MSNKIYPAADEASGVEDSGEASTAAEAEEMTFTYDSMVDIATEAEEQDSLELFDISAVVGRPVVGVPDPEEHPGPNLDPPTQRYALATSARGDHDEPTFDGLIAVDGLDEPPTKAHRPATAQPISTEVTPEIALQTFQTGILAVDEPEHGALSQFRLLKIQVEEIIDRLRYRSIAVTSARDGEGRTTTAINLAMVMSENPWLKVALIDLNFRNPELGRLMQAGDEDPGLLHLLAGRVSFDRAFRKLEGRNLYMLHTGGHYEQSMNVLNSSQFDLFLNRLYESFDLIIIDCPSVASSDDVLVIKQKVDGVFMVFKANSTPVNVMNKAAERLGKDRILGVVLNGVKSKEI
ncbi:MAG: CpsD/CapB family tyrosine-protein kinase [Bradymonadia bacterium]